MQPFRASAALLLVALLAMSASAQVKGRITEVRAYRGQALVTREIAFDAKAGPQELVVTELPEQVIAESLYATGDDNLVIRAVRFRRTAVKEEPRDDVRQLDQQIQAAQDDLAKIAADLSVVEQQGQYLGKLELFVAPTATAEVSKGVLNADQLVKLTEFVFAQRKDLAAQKVQLGSKQKSANDALALLQRKRSELTAGAQRTLREAVLFVEAAAAKPSKIGLSYLAGGVSWTPAYVVRLNGNRDKLAVEYHGVVTQLSGEDWPDVALTLSTSQPNMSASSPLLSPMWLALRAAGTPAPGGGGGFGGAAGYNSQRRDLEAQLKAPAAQPGTPPANGPAGGPGAALPQQAGGGDELLGSNLLAARLQNLELSAPDEVVRAARKMKSGLAEGLAVDYPMAGKVSLQSRADQQMFRIAALDLPAEFYYTAVPLLSDYVYQSAAAINTTDTTLLPGPYNAYLDGAFAGRGDLPLVAKGESMTLGFGTETQLRATRELTDKQTEIKGGNKVLTLSYQLRLQNFMGKPVKVRLWDRIPQPPNDQVTVALADPGQPLSTDPSYVELEKPRGLLRWDVEPAAGATGAKALTLTFKVRLEFDKQLDVGEISAQAEDRMRKDLDSLRELRR